MTEARKKHEYKMNFCKTGLRKAFYNNYMNKI